jgi:hypothetical protein
VDDVRWKLLLVAVGAATLWATAPAFAGSAASDTTPVRLFSDTSVVGTSTLIRHASSVQMTLHTTGLPAQHVVTVWWVVFNNPAACSNGEPPNPATGFPGTKCGPGDLFVPAVQASAVHAAGHVIGSNGMGDYAGYLSVGSTKQQVLFGPGLTNPLGADIHLIVHDHDALQNLGNIGEEIHTVGAGPGADLQFAAHEAS